MERKGKNHKHLKTRERKYIFSLNKTFFIIFEGLSFGEKIKIP